MPNIQAIIVERRKKGLKGKGKGKRILKFKIRLKAGMLFN